MDTLTTLGFALLVPYAALASVDGLYLHLWRYRLHARPESRREHLLHTAYAVLFAMTLALVYGIDTRGIALYAGLGIVLAETTISLWDVWEEPASRRAFGGLSAGESLLHAVLITLRAASLALVLGGKPTSAWALSGPTLPAGYGPFAESVVSLLLPGAAAIAALHVWLAWRYGERAVSPELAAAARC